MKHPRRIRKRKSPNKKRGNEHKETSQETSRLQSPFLHFNSSSMELRDEPNNKVREISAPTIHPQSIKEESPRLSLRSSVNCTNSLTNIQEHSRATCMIATSYHNIPTDFINSSQWVELNVRHFINKLTVTRPAGGRHTK
jgi:hypothetical protein